MMTLAWRKMTQGHFFNIMCVGCDDLPVQIFSCRNEEVLRYDPT
jgi:ribosomal protein S27E